MQNKSLSIPQRGRSFVVVVPLAALVFAFVAVGCGAPASRLRYEAFTREYESPAEYRATARDPGARGEVASPEPVFSNAGGTLERAELIRAALSRNPGLEAARHALRATIARYPQDGALPDPVLSYSVAPLSINSEAVHFGQSMELRQSFPFFGKLDRRREVALAQADVAAMDLESLRIRLAGRASDLFDGGYYLQRAIAVNERHVELLTNLKDVAAARYGSGLAAQEEPLQAEVELAHAVHRRVQLVSRLRIVHAEINALLHRAPGAEVPRFPEALSKPEHGRVAVASLREEALENRPELRRLDAELQGRTAAVRLADREFWPDFGLMAKYSSMWRETEHRWMVGFSVNLPLGRDRRHGAAEEAGSRLLQIESQRAEAVDAVLFEVERAYERANEAAHIVALFDDRLLPASADRLDAARSGYETGETSFLSLIDAERNLRDTELGHATALTDYHRARTDLDRAVGRVPGTSGEGREP